MYRSRERIQDVALLFADMVCFIASYFGGGYLWLVVLRNVSVANMKTELLDSFVIVLVIYMLVLLFSEQQCGGVPRRLFLYRGGQCGAVFCDPCPV